MNAFAFSICCCTGAKNIGNIDKAQVVLTNLVWIISIIVLIGDIVGVIGVFVGIAITFHAIMKYNKGLF